MYNIILMNKKLIIFLRHDRKDLAFHLILFHFQIQKPTNSNRL